MAPSPAPVPDDAGASLSATEVSTDTKDAAPWSPAVTQDAAAP